MANDIATNFTAAHAAELAKMQSGSAKFGPLSLTWSIDISVPKATFDATLYNITIDHAVLDKQNPTATLGGNIGIAKAEVTVNGDFTKKEIDYAVDIEVFGHVVDKKSGKLIGW